MTSTSADADKQPARLEKHNPFGILGVGAAACAACCVGPILGFLAAAGVFTAAGVAFSGVFGLLVLVPAVGWFERRRRRATACAAPAAHPVPVLLGKPVMTSPTSATAPQRNRTALIDR